MRSASDISRQDPAKNKSGIFAVIVGAFAVLGFLVNFAADSMQAIAWTTGKPSLREFIEHYFTRRQKENREEPKGNKDVHSNPDKEYPKNSDPSLSGRRLSFDELEKIIKEGNEVTIAIKLAEVNKYVAAKKEYNYRVYPHSEYITSDINNSSIFSIQGSHNEETNSHTFNLLTQKRFPLNCAMKENLILPTSSNSPEYLQQVYPGGGNFKIMKTLNPYQFLMLEASRYAPGGYLQYFEDDHDAIRCRGDNPSLFEAFQISP